MNKKYIGLLLLGSVFMRAFCSGIALPFIDGFSVGDDVVTEMVAAADLPIEDFGEDYEEDRELSALFSEVPRVEFAVQGQVNLSGAVLDYRNDSELVQQPGEPEKQAGRDIRKKEHRCEACGRVFTELSKLKLHEKINHSSQFPIDTQKPTKMAAAGGFSTEDNGSEFMGQPVEPKKQIGNDSGKKQHQCETCGRVFTEKSYLKKHQIIHTGERRYKCLFEGCGKSFLRSGNLSDHKRIHTGEKSYKCSFEGCPKAFTQSSDLKVHERIHTGERPYKCSVEGCGKAFAQKSNLRRHLKTQHPSQSPIDTQKPTEMAAAAGFSTEDFEEDYEKDGGSNE